MERADVANNEPNDVLLKRLDERFGGSSSELDLNRIEKVEDGRGRGGRGSLCLRDFVLSGLELLPMGSVLRLQVFLER